PNAAGNAELESLGIRQQRHSTSGCSGDLTTVAHVTCRVPWDEAPATYQGDRPACQSFVRDRYAELEYASRRDRDLVFVGIEQVRAGHDHDQRPQRVQHFDRAFLRSEDIGQAAIDVRTLVEAAAAERHTFFPNPRMHHLW